MKITEGRLRVAASDVANFLACQQLTQLDLRAARGALRPPHAVDVGFEDLVRRGEEHERVVLERFRADGHEVADLGGAEDSAERTAAAIRSRIGVIYQGTLTGAGDGVALLGRPDFLVRADLLPAPDGEPRPDGQHYEVVDAKLARTAKARAVLQTAFYSRLLAELQGTEPRWMHLALGNGEFVPFKVRDFAAYERQTRRRLVETLAAGPPAGLYPEPVEHCAICRWSELCAGRRRDDDDLSLVAGMPKGQRRALKGDGIATRRGFAATTELPRLDRVSPDSLDRARAQARLQVASEDEGTIRFRLLEPERDAAARWSRTAGCSRCPNRWTATCSSTSRGPATTPRTAGSSGCSTCSAWWTRPTWTRQAARGTRRSGPSTGGARNGRSRSSSTSSPSGAPAAPGCTSITTTTTSRRRSTI